MSIMKNREQRGEINILLIPLILVVLLLFGAAYFGYWSFGSRQDYKNNTDEKIATAVDIAKQQESTIKDQQFAEAQKSPLKAYTSPAADGTIVVNYPKTWSGYIDTTGNGGGLFDGYFNPQVVAADTGDGTTLYALRVEVAQETYDQVLQDYSGQLQTGTIKVSPYKLPKVPSVVGVKITGQIQPQKKGTMIVLPLRGNTLEVWTESSQYTGDFNKYILPNLTFSP